MRNSSNDPLSTKIIGNGFNGNQLPATFLVPQQVFIASLLAILPIKHVRGDNGQYEFGAGGI